MQFIEPKIQTGLEKFLRQPLIERPLIYLDRWSIIHLINGFILGKILNRYYSKTAAWILVILIIVGYEIFELLLEGLIFAPETLTDKIWDVIVGSFGFWLTTKLFKDTRKV